MIHTTPLSLTDLHQKEIQRISDTVNEFISYYDKTFKSYISKMYTAEEFITLNIIENEIECFIETLESYQKLIADRYQLFNLEGREAIKPLINVMKKWIDEARYLLTELTESLINFHDVYYYPATEFIESSFFTDTDVDKFILFTKGNETGKEYTQENKLVLADEINQYLASVNIEQLDDCGDLYVEVITLTHEDRAENIVYIQIA